jgi:hypothetical protein
MLAVAPGRQLRRLNFVPAQRQDAHTVRAEDLHGLILLNDAPEVRVAVPQAARAACGGGLQRLGMARCCTQYNQ